LLIPDTIAIKGFNIPIRLVKYLYRDRSVYDCYSASDMSIKLDALMSNQRQEFALCHAIITAIEDLYLIQCDEKVIINLSVAFHDIIKNNNFDVDGIVPETAKLFSCNIDVSPTESLIQCYGCFGIYDSIKMSIKYDESMVLQKQWIIACHEIIECVKDIYSLELTEIEIQIFATSLYDIFKNKCIRFDS
jgi:hypothetical protein